MIRQTRIIRNQKGEKMFSDQYDNWLQQKGEEYWTRNDKHYRNRCHDCGKFVNIKKAKIHFVPDTEYTEEENWLLCEKCTLDGD